MSVNNMLTRKLLSFLETLRVLGLDPSSAWLDTQTGGASSESTDKQGELSRRHGMLSCTLNHARLRADKDRRWNSNTLQLDFRQTTSSFNEILTD